MSKAISSKSSKPERLIGRRWPGELGGELGLQPTAIPGMSKSCGDGFTLLLDGVSSRQNCRRILAAASRWPGEPGGGLREDVVEPSGLDRASAPKLESREIGGLDALPGHRRDRAEFLVQ